MNALIKANGQVKLSPATKSKDTVSHINRFNDWMSGGNILNPDLATYRDYLLAGDPEKDPPKPPLSPASVSAHLSSIRAAYRKLTKNRDLFYANLPRKYADCPPDIQKAWVDESIIRIMNAIDPDESKVTVEKIQDEEDSAHLRLTPGQASELMNSFGVDTLKGLRDTAIVALMLCTGIREQELCNLQVDDLRQQFGGELALRIRKGKGCKRRMIPYGELSWVLVLVDKWLELANITDGYVFRGFWRGNKTIRPGQLSTRQIQRILINVPININGQLTQVKPHDLRRTYAKQLKVAGMDILAIRDNLGHADHRTTEGYIGQLDVSDRQPQNVYQFDLSTLQNITV